MLPLARLLGSGLLAHFEINFSDKQKRVQQYPLSCDCSWHLKIVVLKYHQKCAPVKNLSSDCCVPISDVASWWHLRSASRHRLVVPRHNLSTYGRRAFAVSGPAAWNSLSDNLCDPLLLALTVSDVFLRLIWFQSTSTYNTLEVSHSMHHMNSQLTYSLTYLPKLVSISWLRRRAQTCDKVELMRPSDDWPVEDNDEYETEWRLTNVGLKPTRTKAHRTKPHRTKAHVDKSPQAWVKSPHCSLITEVQRFNAYCAS